MNKREIPLPEFKCTLTINVLACSWVSEEELEARVTELNQRLIQAAMDIHMEVCTYDD